MKKGDKVIFIGADQDQVKWGNNDDPNMHLKEGDIVEIEDVEVHSWHTKLYLVGIPGKFNSVSFEPIPNYINPNRKKVSEADLKEALKELHQKRKEELRQAQIDINNAFGGVFRCIKKIT